MSQRPAPRPKFPIGPINRVRRGPKRAVYDRAVAFDILDSARIAHVAFVVDGAPTVVPMSFGRDDETLYLHCARKGRFARALAGNSVSLAVTHLDGIVVARSMFESSMNYRSVVVHGVAREIVDPADHVAALRVISEHLIPGRWDEVRAPTARELRATAVLAIQLEHVSAKVRQGPVTHVSETTDLTVWAGVVPIATSLGDPMSDLSVPRQRAIPDSIARLR